MRESGADPSRFGGKAGFSRDRDDRGTGSGYGSDRNPRSERTSGPPFRKFDAPRGDRLARPLSSDRPARSEGSGGYAGKSGGSFGVKKTYGQSSGGYAGKSSGGYADKSASSFAGKKPYGKSATGGTGKPASTFDKFKGNKKPFGNRTPTRKFKPQEGESAG